MEALARLMGLKHAAPTLRSQVALTLHSVQRHGGLLVDLIV